MSNQKTDDRTNKGNVSNNPGKQDQQHKQNTAQPGNRGDMNDQKERDMDRQNQQTNMPGSDRKEQTERVSTDHDTKSESERKMQENLKEGQKSDRSREQEKGK